MNRIGMRLGWTEGQVYTGGIGLAVAIVLLLFGLPGSFGDSPPLAAADGTGSPASPQSSGPPPPPTVGTAVSSPVPTVRPVSTSTSVPSGGVSSTVPPGTPDDSPPSAPGEPPPEEPCPPADAAAPIIDALGATGVFPDQATTLLLERITGCSATDPAVLLLGVLAELGSGLPDLGVEIPGVPVPYVEILPPIVEAVRPLRDVIDPLCDGVGSASSVFFYGFGTWPAGIGRALATPISQLLLVCGQLRQG